MERAQSLPASHTLAPQHLPLLPFQHPGAASSYVVARCGLNTAGSPSQDLPSVFAQSSGMDQPDVDAAARLSAQLPDTGFCGRSGMLAGVRTLLTNGVPAIMPVAVNEGLISFLLIACAGAMVRGWGAVGWAPGTAAGKSASWRRPPLMLDRARLNIKRVFGKLQHIHLVASAHAAGGACVHLPHLTRAYLRHLLRHL